MMETDFDSRMNVVIQFWGIVKIPLGGYSPLPFAVLRVGEVFFDLYNWNWKAEGTNAKLTGRNSSPQARNYTVFCPLSSDFCLGL
jgi:hypothetical protein